MNELENESRKISQKEEWKKKSARIIKDEWIRNESRKISQKDDWTDEWRYAWQEPLCIKIKLIDGQGGRWLEGAGAG